MASTSTAVRAWEQQQKQYPIKYQIRSARDPCRLVEVLQDSKQSSGGGPGPRSEACLAWSCANHSRRRSSTRWGTLYGRPVAGRQRGGVFSSPDCRAMVGAFCLDIEVLI